MAVKLMFLLYSLQCLNLCLTSINIKPRDIIHLNNMQEIYLLS